MRIFTCCSWCHESVEVNGPTQCPNCGHRADVCRLECDCGRCREGGAVYDFTDLADQQARKGGAA